MEEMYGQGGKDSQKGTAGAGGGSKKAAETQRRMGALEERNRQRAQEEQEEEPEERRTREIGPSLAESARMAKKEGLKEGQAKKAAAAASSGAASASAEAQGSSQDRPERRPRFVPEERSGQPDYDPFFQEGRGKRSREAGKARRAQSPTVQEKKQKGLKEGWGPDREQPLQEGSRKWRMIKERGKEVWEEEQQA